MELKDIRAMKSNVEAQIASALKDLEKETGLTIEGVKLIRSGLVRGFSEPEVSGFEIVLKV